MTKAEMREKRYSIQEMIVYCLLIFVFGGASGAATFSRSDDKAIMRIERKLSQLKICVQELKADVRELKLEKKLRK